MHKKYKPVLDLLLLLFVVNSGFLCAASTTAASATTGLPLFSGLILNEFINKDTKRIENVFKSIDSTATRDHKMSVFHRINDSLIKTWGLHDYTSKSATVSIELMNNVKREERISCYTDEANNLHFYYVPDRTANIIISASKASNNSGGSTNISLKIKIPAYFDQKNSVWKIPNIRVENLK